MIISPHQIISIPGISIMLLYGQQHHLHQRVISVTLFYHIILLLYLNKMYKKLIINGMVRWVVILMEGHMMLATLYKDMLLLVENVHNIKLINRKVYFMTGIKSLKHINKH